MKKLIVVSLLGLISACGHQPPRGPAQSEKLVLHIHEDGTKLFAYSVTGGAGGPGGGRGGMPPGEGRRPPGGGGRGDAGGAGPGMTGMAGGAGGSERRKREESDPVEKIIAETGYCREGYIIFDRYEVNNTRWLRGECKESADDKDWMRFGGQSMQF